MRTGLNEAMQPTQYLLQLIEMPALIFKVLGG
jgi:hypothetical protein